VTTGTRPERKGVVLPKDDQKTREYVLLSLMVCFSNDLSLFDHEIRVNVLHRCWGAFISRLQKRRIHADWGDKHPNTDRWRMLDSTISSLIQSKVIRMGMPIGRGRILLNLEDGGKKVFKNASKRIFKAVEMDFKEFVRDYFLS
jgi:hypothetical protein